MADDISLTASHLGLRNPRTLSAEHWAAEQEAIGPGLQAVMLWSQLCIRTASGAMLSDVDGNEIVDFQGAGGVNSIGHANPRWAKAIADALAAGPAGAFGTEPRREMAAAVRAVLPPPLDRIQLYSGGTEAVEAGLRLAKSVTGKHEFLSFWGGFHGKTMGSLALTAGARAGLGPVPAGYFSAPFPNPYRPVFDPDPARDVTACLENAREVIKQNSTGALAAIVVEPMQGRCGNVVPGPGFLSGLKELAREFDALLICDEMMTGFGRTGSMFAFTQHDVQPDIVTVGKGMGNGYPVTGVIASADTMSAAPFSDPSASSSSFGAFPGACQAVATTTRVMVEDDLPGRADRLGRELLAALAPLAEEAPTVGDVRGRGLAIGIELVADKATKVPASKDQVRRTFLALLEAGVLVMVGGNSLRLYPPLNVETGLAHEAVDIIGRTLREFPRP